mgnify:CR=1 FL=1
MLIPPHTAAYFYGNPDKVFTVARNYYDLRGPVGLTPYVATIYIDIDQKRIEKIFQSVHFTGNEQIYVVDENGKCFYSNDVDTIGDNLTQKLADIRGDKQIFTVPILSRARRLPSSQAAWMRRLHSQTFKRCRN